MIWKYFCVLLKGVSNGLMVNKELLKNFDNDISKYEGWFF